MLAKLSSTSSAVPKTADGTPRYKSPSSSPGVGLDNSYVSGTSVNLEVGLDTS